MLICSSLREDSDPKAAAPFSGRYDVYVCVWADVLPFVALLDESIAK